MNHSCMKSALSDPRRRFIELMQRLNFGRIEGLVIHAGDPILSPPPRIVRDMKFCGDNRARPEADLDDFPLKSEVLDLFEQFDELPNTTIHCLEVKHGLPFRMQVEEVTA